MEPNSPETDDWSKAFDEWLTGRRSITVWILRSLGRPDNFPAYLNALFTFVLAIFAVFAWREASLSRQALRDQLEAMREDQRPWIYAKDLRASWFCTEGDTVGLEIQLSLENVGKSPAYHAELIGEFVFPHKVDSKVFASTIRAFSYPVIPLPPVVDSFDEHFSTCEDHKKWIPSSGKHIYPGQTIKFDNNFVFDRQKIFEDASRKRIVPSPAIFEGCVDYAFGDNKRHQARFIYYLNINLHKKTPPPNYCPLQGEINITEINPYEDTPDYYRVH